MDEESHKFAFKHVTALRQKGLSCDLYPEPAKMKKQMSYANARKVPYVAIIGEEERNQASVSLKNMSTGSQENIKIESLLSMLRS